MEPLEKFFEDLFLKKISYQLPGSVKETLVKIAPWITLVVLVLSVPAILAVFGLGSFVASMSAAYGVSLGFRYYLGVAILVVQVVLMAMSISGLMKREIKGWRFVYYSSLVSVAYGIVSAYGVGSLVWSLLGSAIGFYILFQVKSYYK
jgi:hypothetical protein